MRHFFDYFRFLNFVTTFVRQCGSAVQQLTADKHTIRGIQTGLGLQGIGVNSPRDSTPIRIYTTSP